MQSAAIIKIYAERPALLRCDRKYAILNGCLGKMIENTKTP